MKERVFLVLEGFKRYSLLSKHWLENFDRLEKRFVVVYRHLFLPIVLKDDVGLLAAVTRDIVSSNSGQHRVACL